MTETAIIFGFVSLALSAMAIVAIVHGRRVEGRYDHQRKQGSFNIGGSGDAPNGQSTKRSRKKKGTEPPT